MNTNRYYFRSSNGNDGMTGAMMVSTTKGFAYAKGIANRKFKEYGYKGDAVRVVDLIEC